MTKQARLLRFLATMTWLLLALRERAVRQPRDERGEIEQVTILKGLFAAAALAIGAIIIAIDEMLKAKGSSFRVPVLAEAIGIYLPLELMVPIFLGGLLAYLVEKRHGMVGTKDEAARDRLHRPGTLFAAGLITGEALMGIAVGVAIYATKDRDVLVLPEAFQQGEIVGLVVLAIVGWLLYRTGAKSKALGDVEAGPR